MKLFRREVLRLADTDNRCKPLKVGACGQNSPSRFRLKNAKPKMELGTEWFSQSHDGKFGPLGCHSPKLCRQPAPTLKRKLRLSAIAIVIFLLFVVKTVKKKSHVHTLAYLSIGRYRIDMIFYKSIAHYVSFCGW